MVELDNSFNLHGKSLKAPHDELNSNRTPVYKVREPFTVIPTLTSTAPDISVIVPSYNEVKSIGTVLNLLADLSWSPYTAEVIVVDDGSTDGSDKIIKKFPFVKYIRHTKNQGKGAALKTGFNAAKGEVIVIQDADMEYSPELIPQLVEPILKGKADVVFGSRFLGKYQGMSLSHYVGNRLLSLSASILFDVPITDIMTGSKAFSKAVKDTLNLVESGFEVEIEMTSQSLTNGWRYKEVPIGYEYRTEGESKIGFLDGIKSLFRIFSSVYRSQTAHGI